MDTKQCRRCEQYKPLTEFARHSGWKDGYHSSCKQCLVEASGRIYRPKRLSPIDFKYCSKCNEIKPLNDFHNASGSKDGHRSECKLCVAAAAGWVYRFHEILPEGEKRCTKCQQIFPATNEWFKSDRRRKDGLGTWCKSCASRYTQEYYELNAEKVREYNKQRYWDNPEKQSLYHKDWYQKNKSRHRVAARHWYEKNWEYVRSLDRRRYQEQREDRLAKSRQWRIDNYEEYRAYNSAWFQNNPDRAIAIRKGIDSRRRARKRNLPDTFSVDDWYFCLDYWGSRCAVCLSDQKLVADHWIPLARETCPGTVSENILCLCQHCNATKSAREPLLWLIEMLDKQNAIPKLAEIEAYFEFVKNRNSEE